MNESNILPLPCPFCGSSKILEWKQDKTFTPMLGCGDCGAQTLKTRWNRRPPAPQASEGGVRDTIQNPGVCYVCGAPAFCAVNVVPGAASGGTMKPICDKHNPYAIVSVSPGKPDKGDAVQVAVGEELWLIERTIQYGDGKFTPLHDVTTFWTGDGWTEDALKAARYTSEAIATTISYRTPDWGKGQFREAYPKAHAHMFGCGISPGAPPLARAMDVEAAVSNLKKLVDYAKHKPFCAAMLTPNTDCNCGLADILLNWPRKSSSAQEAGWVLFKERMPEECVVVLGAWNDAQMCTGHIENGEWCGDGFEVGGDEPAMPTWWRELLAAPGSHEEKT